MDSIEKLRSMIADSLGIDSREITDSFSLTVPRFRSSAGSVILGNMVRKAFGKTIDCKGVSDFGELVARAEGKTADVPGNTIQSEGKTPDTSNTSAARVHNPEKTAGMVCGIDIQEIAVFPHSDDYWAESFYTGNFTPDEIAYCVAADSPRHSFAARWCLKEALHKCSEQYYDMPLRDIQAVRMTDGSLRIQIRGSDGQWETLPLACSVSHADNYAVGMVTGLI